MRKIVRYEFTEKDIELLKKPIPDKPCIYCGRNIGCLGCTQFNYYLDSVKEYKDAGILEYAEILNAIRKEQDAIERSHGAIARMKCELAQRIPAEMLNQLL